MIGTSFKEYAFIRVCIFFLHYIAPISIACCVLTLFIRHSVFRIPKLLEIIAIAETAFYLFIYLPRRYYLQHAAIHPTTLSKNERHRLFRLCHENVPDAELYLRKWFNWAPITDINRDNVKEFFCWALLNKGAWGPEDEEELEHYADSIEELLGGVLEPGRGLARPIRLTLDKVNMMHRSLIWYCVSSSAGSADLFVILGIILIFKTVCSCRRYDHLLFHALLWISVPPTPTFSDAYCLSISSHHTHESLQNARKDHLLLASTSHFEKSSSSSIHTRNWNWTVPICQLPCKIEWPRRG